MQWLMIGVGAAFGAMLRGYLARFNPLHSWIPLGTLLANVLGGLLMGVALAYVDRLSPNIKFLLTTGFLGGLTTFSTFSAEVFSLFYQGKILLALGLILLHLTLTLLMTGVGYYMFKA